MKVGLIIGSLRKDSWNKKVAQVVKELFPEDIEVNFIEIVDLPLYNQDLDGEKPHEEYSLHQSIIDHMLQQLKM